MIFNDLSSPAVYLSSRRSGRPAQLVAPGPDDAALEAICATAIRSPDHGRLAPWRLAIVETSARDALARLLLDARPDSHRNSVKDEAVVEWAHQAPALVVVLFKPVVGHKIPLFEQALSAGAVCMNLLHAAHARGFAASWITTWAAENPSVIAAFGGGADDRIAGFMFIGTPAHALEERPRPDYAAVVSRWTG